MPRHDDAAPIAVAMSGGVDSSVVAGLLQRQGHRIVGLTMQLWNQRRLPDLVPEGGTVGRCCSLDDVYDARSVASVLGIPYYVVNFEERFEREVVKPFVRDYLETLDWDKTPPAPKLPGDVIGRTAAKYVEAFEKLTGEKLKL